MGLGIPPAPLFIWGLIGALLLQISQYFYFNALENEELGDLVVYGSTYPLLVAFMAVPLGKALLPIHWFGIFIVFTGVALIEGGKVSHTVRGKIDILGYVAGLAISSLMLDEVLEHVSFDYVVIPYCLGLVLGGFFPLVISSERDEILRIWPSIKKNFLAFGIVELVNVIALLCEVFAIGLGHPALVNTVASAEPAFVIISSQLLRNTPFFRVFFPKSERVHHKLLIIVIVGIGLGLIAMPN